MKYYEVIDHTADLCVRLQAKDLKGLFINAGRALFELKAKRLPLEGNQKKRKVTLSVKADTPEELLVAWLNELLYLSATEKVIFTDFKIKRLDKKILSAVVWAEPEENFELKHEIKAATYHNLCIQKKDSFWYTQIVFDV
ncbi:MAG: archease [Candidatus Omnitrophica bacterium]|nr:archease [Candidatus Omnitrophota bacterium]